MNARLLYRKFRRNAIIASHCSPRIFACIIIDAILVWSPSATYAFDCAAVKKTNVPYQLSMLKDRVTSYLVQIYRGADLTRRQISVVNHRLFVAKFQANFQLENPGIGNETIRIVYNLPTTEYIWAQRTRVVRGKSIIDGKPSSGPGFEATYAMLADDVIALGECSFPVKHYTVRQDSPSVAMMSEVWFSPQLNTVLRMTKSTLITSTGKTSHSELEARSIETRFEPFR